MTNDTGTAQNENGEIQIVVEGKVILTLDMTQIVSEISQLALEAIQGKVPTRKIVTTVQVPERLCKMYEKGLKGNATLEEAVSVMASQGLANHLNSVTQQATVTQPKPGYPSVPPVSGPEGLVDLGKSLGLDTTSLQKTLGKFQEVIHQLDQRVQKAGDSIPHDIPVNRNEAKNNKDPD